MSKEDIKIKGWNSKPITNWKKLKIGDIFSWKIQERYFYGRIITNNRFFGSIIEFFDFCTLEAKVTSTDILNAKRIIYPRCLLETIFSERDLNPIDIWGEFQIIGHHLDYVISDDDLQNLKFIERVGSPQCVIKDINWHKIYEFNANESKYQEYFSKYSCLNDNDVYFLIKEINNKSFIEKETANFYILNLNLDDIMQQHLLFSQQRLANKNYLVAEIDNEGISITLDLDSTKVENIAIEIEKITGHQMNGHNWDAFLSYYLELKKPELLENMVSDSEDGMYAVYYSPGKEIQASDKKRAKSLVTLIRSLIDKPEVIYKFIKAEHKNIEWDSFV